MLSITNHAQVLLIVPVIRSSFPLWLSVTHVTQVTQLVTHSDHVTHMVPLCLSGD